MVLGPHTQSTRTTAGGYTEPYGMCVVMGKLITTVMGQHYTGEDAALIRFFLRSNFQAVYSCKKPAV